MENQEMIWAFNLNPGTFVQVEFEAPEDTSVAAQVLLLDTRDGTIWSLATSQAATGGWTWARWTRSLETQIRGEASEDRVESGRRRLVMRVGEIDGEDLTNETLKAILALAQP